MFRLALFVIGLVAGEPSMHTQAQVCRAFGGVPQQSCYMTLAACSDYDGAPISCPNSTHCGLWCVGVDGGTYGGAGQFTTLSGTSDITTVSTSSP